MAHLPPLNPTKNSRNPYNPPLMKPPSNESLAEARRRIADCFHGRDRQGRLIQRRDALNLAGLGLTAEQVEERFDFGERGLGNVGFEDLIHLRYLDLTSNQLTRLPRGTGGFSKLRWLGLNFNRLGSIADEAGDWTDLERLYLRGNSLETLPEAVATWPRLVEVDLTGNESLKSLPPAWLDALAQRNASQDGASPIVVELAGSGLDLEYRRQTKSKLTRDNFHEKPVREWLRKRAHTPEKPSLRPPRPPDPILLKDLPVPWTPDGLAHALVRLSREEAQWLRLMESPERLPGTVFSPDEAKALEAALARQEEASGHALWKAWFVAKFDRAQRDLAGVSVGLTSGNDVEDRKVPTSSKGSQRRQQKRR